MLIDLMGVFRSNRLSKIHFNILVDRFFRYDFITTSIDQSEKEEILSS